MGGAQSSAITFSAALGTGGVKAVWDAAAGSGAAAAVIVGGAEPVVSTTTGCSRFANAAAGSFFTGAVVLVSSVALPKPMPKAVTTVAMPAKYIVGAEAI